MLDTQKYRRRRDESDSLPIRGVIPGRRAGKDRRASSSEQLARVEDELRNAHLLRFSDHIEGQFQAERLEQRVRHFVKTGMLAIFTFDIFLIPDKLIFTDIFPLTVIVQLGVVTPIAFLILLLIHKRKLPPEAVFVNICLTYGAMVYGSALSHAPNAVFVVFTLPIFLVFSNIGYPLPFRLATIYTAICTVSLAVELFWTGRLDNPVRYLMLLIELSMGAYTLIATYRLEAAERRSYLLTLRETLRGETLVAQNRELSDLSETDGLTGVPNRRAFDRSLERRWNEHLQSRTPVALIMIDIDHFKRLNDTYGHNNGDLCLRKTADRLRGLMRPHQTVSRYGGEEFAILLEGEGAYQADQVAERLRAEIEAMSIKLVGHEDEPHHMTISLGCATVIPRLDLSPAELFIAADKALYTAKHGGRNRVHAHSLDPVRPPDPPAPAPRPPAIAFLDAIAKN